MIAAGVSFVQKAEAAWGVDDLPTEIRALAERADATNGASAAKTIGMSPATFSHLIGRKGEKHNLERIFAKIRGALLGETVECPRKGEMSRKTCLDWQGKPFAATSADRVAMWHACRSGCPHSRLKGV